MRQTLINMCFDCFPGTDNNWDYFHTKHCPMNCEYAKEWRRKQYLKFCEKYESDDMIRIYESLEVLD